MLHRLENLCYTTGWKPVPHMAVQHLHIAVQHLHMAVQRQHVAVRHQHVAE